MDPSEQEYWAPRRCLREPIPELFQAAFVLEEACSNFLSGRMDQAVFHFRSVNTQVVRDFIESLWGSKNDWPEQEHYVRYREVDGIVHPERQIKDRMPRNTTKTRVIERDGFRCRYCGVPVIPEEVRIALSRVFPNDVPWPTIGKGMTQKQHAALQAPWMQFDHVIPYSLGGDSSLGNVVICCAGCNYGKGNWHLDELGLIHPLKLPPIRSSWNGLVHILDRH